MGLVGLGRLNLGCGQHRLFLDDGEQDLDRVVELAGPLVAIGQPQPHADEILALGLEFRILLGKLDHPLVGRGGLLKISLRLRRLGLCRGRHRLVVPGQALRVPSRRHGVGPVR